MTKIIMKMIMTMMMMMGARAQFSPGAAQDLGRIRLQPAAGKTAQVTSVLGGCNSARRTLSSSTLPGAIAGGASSSASSTGQSCTLLGCPLVGHLQLGPRGARR